MQVILLLRSFANWFWTLLKTHESHFILVVRLRVLLRIQVIRTILVNREVRRSQFLTRVLVHKFRGVWRVPIFLHLKQMVVGMGSHFLVQSWNDLVLIWLSVLCVEILWLHKVKLQGPLWCFIKLCRLYTNILNIAVFNLRLFFHVTWSLLVDVRLTLNVLTLS